MKLKPTNKKKLKIIIPAVLLLIAVGIGAFFTYKYNTEQSSNNSSNQKIEKQQNKSKSEVDSSKNGARTEEEKSTNNSDPQAPTTLNKETGKTQVSVVTSVDMSDGIVYIRGGINNAVSDGSCYAELKHASGKVVKKTTELLPNASTADCKTIKIPVSELSNGVWTYKLHYTSPTTEGVSSENSFQVN